MMPVKTDPQNMAAARLCDLASGYHLGTARRQLASYRPALGQIWIMPGVAPADLAYVRAHEQHHYRMSDLAFGQILPLHKALSGESVAQEVERCRDLIETFYVALLPLEAGLNAQPRFFPPALPRYRELGGRLYAIAQRFAKAGLDLGTRQATNAAVRAICHLLGDIIPSRPGQGFGILKEIAKLRAPSGWKDSYDLYVALYHDLESLLSQATSLPFILTYLGDRHIRLFHAILLLDYVSAIPRDREDDLIAVLPSLLSVISLGSFHILPLVHLRGDRTRRHAVIRLHHPVHAHESVYDAMARKLEGLSKRPGGDACHALRIMLSSYRTAKPYRLSQEPSRLSEFVHHLVLNLGRELSDVPMGGVHCRMCRQILFDPFCLRALFSLREHYVRIAGRMAEAAKEYDAWLGLGAIALLRAALSAEGVEIGGPVHSVRRYRRL